MLLHSPDAAAPRRERLVRAARHILKQRHGLGHVAFRFHQVNGALQRLLTRRISRQATAAAVIIIAVRKMCFIPTSSQASMLAGAFHVSWRSKALSRIVRSFPQPTNL
jgi:hypothetical protein